MSLGSKFSEVRDNTSRREETNEDKRLEGVGTGPSASVSFSPTANDMALAKQLKRETEAQKLKYKSNAKQFLHNAEVEEKVAGVVQAIHENDQDTAYENAQEALKLIQKRQKLIKLAGKSEGGWLVVQEYENDELADNSENEKKIKKAQEKGSKKRKLQIQAKAAKRPCAMSHTSATITRPEDRQLFRVKSSCKKGEKPDGPYQPPYKRMSAFEFSEIVTQENLKTLLQVQALAAEHKEKGKTDVAEFLLNRTPRAIADILTTTWEMLRRSYNEYNAVV
ncbi:hypothetical protein AC249_AIPGENE21535 [Exaiptasia diaphana]|nr:hypothetical protein AC249_AIPGENE21535 [Exaiptasia diaphana]